MLVFFSYEPNSFCKVSYVTECIGKTMYEFGHFPSSGAKDP